MELGHDQCVIHVSVDSIDPNPHQPRVQFDEQADWRLGRSMLKEGQKVPARVTRQANGRYQLVGGERRLRAAKLVGMLKLKVIVEPEALSEEGLAKDQLIDNLHGKKFTLKDITSGLQMLSKQGLNYGEIADALEISTGQVSRGLTINNRLIHSLQEDLQRGALSVHAAYRISTLPTHHQFEVGEQVKRGELNRPALEAKVRDLLGKGSSRSPKAGKLVIPLPPDAGWDETEELMKGLLKCIQKCRASGVPGHLVLPTLRAEL